MSSPPVTPDKPIEITLGDGSVVKGKDMDEAFKNLASMKENTSAALKQAKDQLTAEQERLANLSQEVERLKHPPAADNGKFNNEKYYRLLNSDPIGAQNYLDAARFGFDAPEQVVPSFNDMRTRVDNITQSSVAAAFLANHVDDFPADAEAAKKLNARTFELVNKSGFNFDVHTLDFAYNQLVNEGQIKPLDKAQQPEEPPNPTLIGGGGGVQPDISKLEQMSDKDLEALMRSKGMIR